jgi:hypothetical protein
LETGGYKAHSTSYYYAVLAEEEHVRREILAFHWHPETTRKLQWPHLHVIPENDDARIPYIHFPTGRCPIEDFIYMLIRDLKVRARMPYDEWRRILVKNKGEFVKSATWLHI